LMLTTKLLGIAALGVGSTLVLCLAGLGCVIALRATEAQQLAVLSSLKADFVRPTDLRLAAQNAGSDAALLGRKLFFDAGLSGSGHTACATCHDPAKGWADGRARSVGDTGVVSLRRSPTIVDVAWGGPYFWDGRAATLEEQAKGPLGSPLEMNMGLAHAAAAVKASPAYSAAFAKAYPGQLMTIDLIVGAIAAFERTVVSPDAPFDRWVTGDEDAISSQAKRGFALFNGKANCASCHSTWRFTDDGFHDIGLDTTDLGRAAIDPGNPLMMYAVKTPTLRNVAVRAPYMHDGSIATLQAVVEHYDRGGLPRRSRAPDVRPLGLTAREREDLVAFLGSLTTGHSPPEHASRPL
jgi:cytochrome c peroxidase